MDNNLPAISFATTGAIDGINIFLKEDKSFIPYKRLDVNVYTITRNVYNNIRPDPTNFTHKDKAKLMDALVTELNYLNNILTIDVNFYLPKVEEPTLPKSGKKTKALINDMIIHKMANHISKGISLKDPVRGSIILTNSMTGIVGLNNPILRSFTGDVLFKQEHYKLLRRSPPVLVTKDMLTIFGDDLVKGVQNKTKDVNDLLKRIKEAPFKLSLNIKSMMSNIIKGTK